MSGKSLSMAVAASVCRGSAIATQGLPLFLKDGGTSFQVSSHSPDLGEIRLAAGEHTAEVEIAGTNPDSKGSELMIDCLSATK